MKVVVLIILLIGSSLANSTPLFEEVLDGSARILEEFILTLVECIRSYLINGVPKYDIRSFNPLEINTGVVDLGSYGNGVSGTLSVEDFTFYGLTDFEILVHTGDIIISPPSFRLNLKLLFGNPRLETTYYLNSISENYGALYGYGTFMFNCYNFTIDVSVDVNIGGTQQISNVRGPIELENCTECTVTGLRDDEDHSSNVSQNCLNNAPDLVSTVSPVWERIFSEGLENLVNSGSIDDIIADALVTCIS